MAKTTRRAAKASPKTKTRTSKAKPAARAATRKATKPAKGSYEETAAQMQTLTPYLAVNDAKGAIAWYGKVFGAKPFGGDPMPGPGGKIMHAQLKIGDSLLFVSDIFPQSDLVDATRAGASVNLNYFRRDADKVWARAIENGAKVTMPFADQFWGDQYGRIVDPYGHSWAISKKSKLSKKELAALQEQAMKQMGAQQG